MAVYASAVHTEHHTWSSHNGNVVWNSVDGKPVNLHNRQVWSSVNNNGWNGRSGTGVNVWNGRTWNSVNNGLNDKVHHSWNHVNTRL